MADIAFYAGENFTVNHLSGSGLGFYGGSFAASVPVGDYQDKTYITNSNGTTQGPEVDNIKYHNAGSGIVGAGGSGIPVTAIPNYQATLNIRFTHSSAVQTSSGKVYFYDRVSISNAPSGVTVKAAEIIHPTETQVDNGSGDPLWLTPAGTAIPVDLIDSPGTSGLRPNGASTSDTRHDWYLAISASPDSIGSKLFALYASVEYL